MSNYLADQIALFIEVTNWDNHELRDEPYYTGLLDRMRETYGKLKRDHSWTDASRIALAQAIREIIDSTEPQGGSALRPIETAPHDGTWILGWAKSESAPYRISWGRNHRGDIAWCSACGSFVEGYITHWMPLPEICDA